MLNFNPAQIKFAGKIAKQKAGSVKHNPMKTVIDLPISSEMIELIDSTVNNNDEEGYINDKVGSMLSQPLSSMAILCPTAAVLQSTTTASKIPAFRTSTLAGTGTSFDNNSNASVGTAEGDRPTLEDTKSRLEVMWLQRKAELSRESGDLQGAISILDEALNEHLGGRGYLEAGLSKGLVSSDPHQLLEIIDQDFFVYDQLAHRKAAKIQKLYRGWFRFKAHMATTLARVFRGHMHRKVVRRYRENRRQCAVLVQRRFRIHLVRMNRLATMIKVWYRLRKDVKAYQRRLHVYQAARKIQRLFRGNQGRRRYRRKRREMDCRMAIQKNVRGFHVRRDRSFALMLFHRTYFLAARRIQQLVRRAQAVQRAQIKLLVELTRESIRAKKEQVVVLEAQRMTKVRTHYYVRTPPGRLRLRDMRAQLQARRVLQAQAALDEDQALLARVVAIVERYDEDGTGRFDTRRLKKILQRLAIPASKEYLCHLTNKLDAEDIGFVAIDDFLQWYQSVEVDELLEPTAYSARMERVRLEAMLRLRQAVKVTRFSAKVSEETLRREQASWVRRDTVSSFRQTHPAKYQCCQCLAPFVMFTDYYQHFHRETGHCQVTDQRALFFPHYWVTSDWRRQRQIEYEVIRVNDEVEFCRSTTRAALYAELAYGHMGRGNRELERMQIKQATAVYKDLCVSRGLQSKELKASTIDMIFEILNIATDANAPPKAQTEAVEPVTPSALSAHSNSKSEKSGGKTGQADKRQQDEDRFRSLTNIPLYLLQCVVEVLRLPMKNKWVAEERCGPLMELRNWLIRYIKDTHLDADHASYSDNHKDALKSSANKLNPEDNKVFDEGLLAGRLRQSGGKLLKPRSEAGKIHDRCCELAAIYVKVLRLVYVMTCSELFALIEFRTKRPRRSTISEEDLEALQLVSLTRASYEARTAALLNTLRSVQHRYQHIYSAHVPRYCQDTILFWRRMLRYAPVAAEEDRLVSARELVQRQLAEVQHWARAEGLSKAASPLGRLVVRRLGALLRNQGNILVRGNTRSRKMDSAEEARLLYLFVLCCCSRPDFSDPSFQMGDVNTLDLDLLLAVFGLRIKNAAKGAAALEALDPKGNGSISFDQFKRWHSAEATGKQYGDPMHPLRGAYSSALDWLRVRRATELDAQRALEVSKRHLLRNDLLLQSRLLTDAGDFHFCEGGDRGAIVKYLDDEQAERPAEDSAPQASEPVKAEQPVEEEAESAFGVVADKPLDANAMWLKRQQLLQREAEGENDAFFDFVERKAEKKFWQLIATGNAWEAEKLAMERRLVAAMDGVLAAVGRCGSFSQEWVQGELTIIEAEAPPAAPSPAIRRSSKSARVAKSVKLLAGPEPIAEGEQVSPALGHRLYLETLVNLLDVSCTGALDARVVRCVLQSYRCPLSDRELFFLFPELASSEGLISTAALVDHIKGRLAYVGASPLRVTEWRLAANMLVAVRRQRAHAGVQQTVALTSFGHIAVVDRAAAVRAVNGGEDDFRSVIVRTQALAVRQVGLFAETFHGQLKLHLLEKSVAYQWELHVNGPLQREQLLRYAVALHCERNRVLVTELPYLVHFLCDRFGFGTNETALRRIPHLLSGVRTGRDLRWFPSEDLLSLLDPIVTLTFANRPAFLLRSTKADALVAMQSCARQQAVLVAMNSQDITVPETNYRCSVLGLTHVMAQLGEWLPSRGDRPDLAAAADKASGLTRAQHRSRVDWACIPRECTSLYLASAGYLKDDLSAACFEGLVAMDHSSGVLQTDPVAVADLRFLAREGIDKKATWRSTLSRLGKQLRPVKNFKVNQDYKFAVMAMQQYPEAVNKKGADFLKELMSGVSHCAFDQN